MRDLRLKRHDQGFVHSYTPQHSLKEFLQVSGARTVKIWDEGGNATVWHVLTD